MNLLALDTATEACSVALLCDGQLLERHALAPRQHAELLLPWIDQLLAEAGLPRSGIDAIAVGRGPGGFTGVRLAVAAAQGIAFGLDRPLLPVSSLAALAMQAPAAPGERVLAAIDARMGELYLGAYERSADGLVVAVAEEWMASPNAPRLPLTGPWHGVGSGYAAAAGALANALADTLLSCSAELYPHAAAIARLGLRDWQEGRRCTPEQLEPAYLRDKVAQTLAERGQPLPQRN